MSNTGRSYAASERMFLTLVRDLQTIGALPNEGQVAEDFGRVDPSIREVYAHLSTARERILRMEWQRPCYAAPCDARIVLEATLRGSPLNANPDKDPEAFWRFTELEISLPTAMATYPSGGGRHTHEPVKLSADDWMLVEFLRGFGKPRKHDEFPMKGSLVCADPPR